MYALHHKIQKKKKEEKTMFVRIIVSDLALNLFFLHSICCTDKKRI